mgnify:CR=1 FL=1
MNLNKKSALIPLIGMLSSTLVLAQTIIPYKLNSDEFSEKSIQERRKEIEQRGKALLEANSKKPEVAGVESPKPKQPAVTVEGEKIPAPVTAKPAIPAPPSVQEMLKPSPAETSETVKVPSGANSVLKPPAEVSEAKTPTLQPVAETKKPEIKEVLKVQQPEQVKPLPKSDAVVPTTQEIPKPSLEAPEVKAPITPK